MKKILVFLLCAMLTVPSVGMNVQATEAQQGENQPQTAAVTESAADAVAQDAAMLLNKYFTAQKFADAEKAGAIAVLKEAALELGLSCDEKTGKLEEDPSKATTFTTVEAVNEYIKLVKDDLAACKKAEDSAEEGKADGSGTTDNSAGEGKAEATDKNNSSADATGDGSQDAANTNSNIIIGGKEYDTTIANAGQECTIAVPLVNLGKTNVTNIVITPALSGEVASWPFEISKTDYSKTCDILEGVDSGKNTLDRKHTFRWTLKTRDDAITGYTKLVFNVSYNEADGTKGTVALDYYVQVNGVSPEEETEEDGKVSTPRVIVTGFTTTPEEVYAGDIFKLTLNLKNTSKETAVSNMLFDIQGTQEGTDATNTYAAFLPTAGSSTIYVDSIAPNSTKSITIELKSKADLAQKPYVVTVDMEYEDKDANAFTDTASVSIPIKQEAKVDISSITLMPEMVEIGNEANVMFSIYNVGKTKLYNVNVKFVADSISGGDTFIGNMEPGATGNVDAYLAAQAATMDDGIVKILITYEDEEGKEATIEETMTLFVSEPYYEEVMMDDMMMEGMEEEKAGLPWWAIALIAVAAVTAVIAAVIVMKKKKRAKIQEKEELEIIDLLEDNSSAEE